MSPRTMPPSFAGFHLTVSGSRSRNVSATYGFSPSGIWCHSPKRQLTSFALSPLTEHPCHVGFPSFRNSFIHPLALVIIPPSLHLSFIIYFCPHFSTFGRDGRFDHCAGPNCQQQCSSCKCLPLNASIHCRVIKIQN